MKKGIFLACNALRGLKSKRKKNNAQGSKHANNDMGNDMVNGLAFLQMQINQ